MAAIKEGAKVGGLRPEILLAYIIAETVYRQEGFECILTEGTGSKHGRGSLHYVGLAIDLRTRMISGAKQLPLAQTLADKLGDEYDVVLETDHIHIEFQPK